MTCAVEHARQARAFQAQAAPPCPLRLPVTAQDRAGLVWLEGRCGELVVYLRRRRKRIEGGPLSEREVELLTALVQAESATRRLGEAL